jgi:hypothetical protein
MPSPPAIATPVVPAPLVPAPQTPAQQSSQQLADAAKSRLEQFGYRVLEAAHRPADGNQPAIFGAVTEAWYPQPNGAAVFGQALTVWTVLSDVLGGGEETLKTMLVAGQMWTHYVISLGAPAGAFRTFLQAASTSPDDEGRAEAFRQFEPHLRIAVLDTQTGQYVDQKDFINKHFTQ